jgi:hypothetical protein
MLSGEFRVHVLQRLHDARPMPRVTIKHEAQLLFKTIAFASHRFHVPSMRCEAEAAKRIDELRTFADTRINDDVIPAGLRCGGPQRLD